VVLFTVGGVFSVYEGFDKLSHPHELTNAWLPILVLSVAILLESFSLATAIRESKKVKGKQSWIQFIRHAKSPELPVVLLEDVAALLGLVLALGGVGLTVITGNPIFDAYGTLAIGALLVVVAVILGLEMGSLLIGEGAQPHEVAAIREALLATTGVKAIIHMKTLYVGPEELMVAAKIGVDANVTGQEIANIIDAAESEMRKQLPVAQLIYLEPDIVRTTNA
jgi:divalent metal cation (Fe/Co/Zn/Cd) transporter